MSHLLTCAQVRERDIIPAYVSGDLADDVAEAFERHYFECHECSDELMLASSVRDATNPRVERTANRSALPRRTVARFAAVAAALVLTVVVWRVVDERDRIGTVRSGPSNPIAVSSEVTDTAIQLRWPAVPAAARYEVRVNAEDGTPLFAQQSDEPSSTIDRADLSGRPSRIVVAVDALDALGTSVGASRSLTIQLNRP